MEHQDALAQKEEAIKIQRDEFKIENNRVVKYSQGGTKKEIENTYNENSKRRGVQQCHSNKERC